MKYRSVKIEFDGSHPYWQIESYKPFDGWTLRIKVYNYTDIATLKKALITLDKSRHS